MTNAGIIKITNGPAPRGNGGNGQEGAVVKYQDRAEAQPKGDVNGRT